MSKATRTMIKVDRKELSRALSMLTRISSKQHRTMPILQSVYVASDEKGDLQLAATDLELGAVWRFPGTAGPAKPFCVDARMLSQLVRKSKGPEVKIRPVAKGVKVSIGTADTTLPTLSGDEYPTLPTKLSAYQRQPVPVGVVAKLCSETVYAASGDETRYNLNSVFVEPMKNSDRLQWVATDGHRLAISHSEVGIDWPMPENGIGIMVPRAFAEELGKLVSVKRPIASEVEFAAVYHNTSSRRESTGGAISATLGPVTMWTRLTEGEFPNYRNVIPTSSSCQILVGRDALMTALESIMPMTPERVGVVRLTIGDENMEVHTSHPERGESSLMVPVEPTFNAVGVIVGVSVHYLRDAVKAAAGANLSIRFVQHDAALGPIRIEADGSEALAIVMPMRI